jgi:polysaccharide export outer membrane protein
LVVTKEKIIQTRKIMYFRVPLLLLVAAALAGCFATSPIKEREVATIAASETGFDKNYKLRPNDIVRVQVFQEADMVTEEQIAADGSIAFPLIGRVQIAGQTVGEAAESIAARLRKGFLTNPQVSLSVITYAPMTFTILGQVGGPGTYEIPPTQTLTLPMAVARAGGNTRIGNLRNIQVTRKRDDKVIEITVNLLSTEGRQFIVKEGDLITVQESLF